MARDAIDCNISVTHNFSSEVDFPFYQLNETLYALSDAHAINNIINFEGRVNPIMKFFLRIFFTGMIYLCAVIDSRKFYILNYDLRKFFPLCSSMTIINKLEVKVEDEKKIL